MKNSIDKHFEKLDAAKETLARVKNCQGDLDVNDWEEEFLESIETKIMDGRLTELSEAQEETLEKIEYKVAHGLEAYWEQYGGRW
jgi:hypothetical protein